METPFGGIIVYSLGSYPKSKANFDVRPGSIFVLSSFYARIEKEEGDEG